MNIAFIGYGNWAKTIRRYIDMDSRFNLKRIYKPNNENRLSIFTSDIDDIMQDKEIEAVFILSPTHTHMEYIVKCIENNKHIFCEKPLCRPLETLDGIEQMLKEQDLVLYTDYIYLVSESVLKAKELLKQIGNPSRINCCIYQNGKVYPDESVFETIGVHIISLIMFMFDVKCADEVTVSSKTYVANQSKVPLAGEIYMEYEGVEFCIRCSLVNPEKERSFEIIGSRGSVSFNMYRKEKLLYIEYGNMENDFDTDVQCWSFNESDNIARTLNGFYGSFCRREATSNFAIAKNVNSILSRIANC